MSTYRNRDGKCNPRGGFEDLIEGVGIVKCRCNHCVPERIQRHARYMYNSLSLERSPKWPRRSFQPASRGRFRFTDVSAHHPTTPSSV